MHRLDSTAPAFYHPAAVAAGEVVALAPEEERHARAHRLRAGDHVLLLDGEGHRTPAVVQSVDRTSIMVRPAESVLDVAEGRLYIVACVGILADRTRFEWLVEKCVELGVREIVPLVTDRSEGRLHAERARRIAIAALKQSQRSYLPTISEPTPFALALERCAGAERSYLCHEVAPARQSLVRAIRRQADSPHAGMQHVLVFTGPEGGFSEREVAACRASGAEVVSLGEARLRAETAALVAIAITRNLLEVASDGAPGDR